MLSYSVYAHASKVRLNPNLKTIFVIADILPYYSVFNLGEDNYIDDATTTISEESSTPSVPKPIAKATNMCGVKRAFHRGPTISIEDPCNIQVAG